MADEKSPGFILFLSLMASMIRVALIYVLGRFGVQWSEDQLGNLTTIIASAVVMLLVLTWSMIEKRVLLNTQPPAKPAPETSDEKHPQQGHVPPQ